MYFQQYFIKSEVKQFKRNKGEYFTDPWNIIDSTNILLNLLTIILLNINVWSDSIIINSDLVRAMGAVGCFVMWVKVFYWMRLFNGTAPFVTLIIATLRDIRVFMVMLFIIIAGFANFFYIMNLNSLDTADAEGKAVDDYGLGAFVNSIL